MQTTQRLSIEDVSKRVKEIGIVPIVRGNFPLEEILEIGDALLAAPAPVMEVTLNSANALEAIGALRSRFGDNMLVGAGTVRTAEQVDQAVAAGAQFIVAPNFDPEAVARSLAHGILHLPGIFTPTEAHNAFMAGCRIVKLFPSDVVGPRYLKALRAPLNDIEFIPTGGISVDNIADYARAGAVAVGMGSSLIPNKWNAADIISTARLLRERWAAGKKG
ncbi:MAG: bifunctional 4-hydroxy-2-oxoglutarate aldolase/2-dehydro-3-deoxy-phosphogluconate aldolase [Caldilineaceae bacterium]|nr:bifunctional 4-hydroxy-2-oxoglutarate aldolase/2-dehydro-3-deoxy-phosphogluconate aldolase [Caldilineaceae bacterium]